MRRPASSTPAPPDSYTFCEEARGTLDRARELVIEAGGVVVTGLHLLAALLESPSPDVAAFLSAQGLDSGRLLAAVRAELPPPRTPLTRLGALPYANDAKHALELALAAERDALDGGHPSWRGRGTVGPLHLLIGLARLGPERRRLLLFRTGSRASTLLLAAGVDADAAQGLLAERRQLPFTEPPSLPESPHE